MGQRNHVYGVYETSCLTCGVQFCMPISVEKARREDHQSFYCPNGHTMYFPGKTKEEKEIEQLNRSLRRWINIANDRAQERNDLKELTRHCPFPECEYRVIRVSTVENIRIRLLTHLVDEHGAKFPKKAKTREKVEARS